MNALDGSTEPNTPREALVPNIYYGLLAHGHSWNEPNSNPFGVITGKLQSLLNGTPKMRDALSLLCVANLAAWDALRITYDGPKLWGQDFWEERMKRHGAPTNEPPLCAFSYMNASKDWDTYSPTNPLGALVAKLVGRLAFADETLRPLSQYFFAAGMGGPTGSGSVTRFYALNSQLSKEVVDLHLPHALTNGATGDWSLLAISANFSNAATVFEPGSGPRFPVPSVSPNKSFPKTLSRIRVSALSSASVAIPAADINALSLSSPYVEKLSRPVDRWL